MKEKLVELIEQTKYCSPEEMAEYFIAAGLVLSNCNRDCRNCWKTKLVNPVETDNMEEKFNELIEILKFLVEVDTGISKQHSDWILEVLKGLEE